MLTPLVMWGASGHAKVLRELIGTSRYRLVALFDNDQRRIPPFADIRLHHGRDGFMSWRAGIAEEHAFLVAIGGSRGRDRLEIHEFLVGQGLRPAAAIHPSAVVAADARIGAGSQVLAHATICVEAALGRECIVNTASSVDHECVLGDGVHIGPGATLAGCVTVGDSSMIGAGAVVLPRIVIGRDAIVGAGAVVTRDLPDGAVAWGSPARIIRLNGQPPKERP
jgi:sugar O-acyltransferase (sialic acid O-acetyltransferase NeuD family)